jgi:hypothetical protein
MCMYIDDVLIPSTTIKEGLENLENVLDALSTAGFRLNYDKCTFFSRKTEYLGVLNFKTMTSALNTDRVTKWDMSII